MITNNLMIRLKERSPEQIAAAKDKLLSMEGKMEFIRSIRAETDIRSGAYDLMLIVQYESMEDLEAYLVHPVHVEVSNYIAGVLESAASFCY